MLYEVITPQQESGNVHLGHLDPFRAEGRDSPGHEAREPETTENRITSYNVCYTKLLRFCTIGISNGVGYAPLVCLIVEIQERSFSKERWIS